MAILPIKSRKDALNWLRCLDLYELTELPPVQALEVAKNLVNALTRYRLPIRRDYILVLENLTTAYDIGQSRNPHVPTLAVPRRS